MPSIIVSGSVIGNLATLRSHSQQVALPHTQVSFYKGIHEKVRGTPKWMAYPLQKKMIGKSNYCCSMIFIPSSTACMLSGMRLW